MSKIFTPNGTIDQDGLKQAAREKEIKDFLADVTQVFIKHKKSLIPVLKTMRDGIITHLDVTDIPEEELEKLKEESKK